MTVGSLSSSRSWQKGFQLLIVQHYVGYRSVKNSFYYVEMFPPHLLWWESMLFLHLFEMTAWSFLLLMWFITLTDSHVLNHPRDSGTNPSWLQHMIFYICCWIWLANIVLRVFHLNSSKMAQHHTRHNTHSTQLKTLSRNSLLKIGKMGIRSLSMLKEEAATNLL